MRKRLIVAAIGIPLVALLLVLPEPALTLLITLIVLLSLLELFSASSVQLSLITLFSAIAAAAFLSAVYFKAPTPVLAAIAFIFMIILFLLWVAYHEKNLNFTFITLTVALLSGAVIPLCLSSLVTLRASDSGLFKVIIPFAAAFISDAGALFSGMLLGKHKLAPKTSPKKTVEGAVGAIVSSAAFMVLYYVFLKYAVSISANLTIMLSLGIICGSLAQLGDLAFSLIKREFDIKDYGSLLPGHGGILDRFDSMITVAPAVALCFIFLPPF